MVMHPVKRLITKNALIGDRITGAPVHFSLATKWIQTGDVAKALAAEPDTQYIILSNNLTR